MLKLKENIFTLKTVIRFILFFSSVLKQKMDGELERLHSIREEVISRHAKLEDTLTPEQSWVFELKNTLNYNATLIEEETKKNRMLKMKLVASNNAHAQIENQLASLKFEHDLLRTLAAVGAVGGAASFLKFRGRNPQIVDRKLSR